MLIMIFIVRLHKEATWAGGADVAIGGAGAPMGDTTHYHTVRTALIIFD